MDWTLFITLYLISIPIFFVVDMLWLGWLSRDLYQSRVGQLLGPINWTAAIGFYLVYIVGITYFATYPAVMSGDVTWGFMLGGLFGFFTYATYDMTNLATLRGWSRTITVIDIAWGTVLGAVVSGGTVFLVLSFLVQ